MYFPCASHLEPAVFCQALARQDSSLAFPPALRSAGIAFAIFFFFRIATIGWGVSINSTGVAARRTGITIDIGGSITSVPPEAVPA